MLRTSRIFGVAAAALLLAGFLCGPVTAAESNGSHPGSLLLYPYFSTEGGIQTFMRVTNTSPVQFPGTDLGDPAIRVHWIFFFVIDRVPPQRPICNRISTFDPLTPADTLLTSVAGEGMAPNRRGFFIAKAVSPFPGSLDVNWDFLIGDEVVLNTAEGWAWAINAIGILADQDSLQGDGISIPLGDPDAAVTGHPEDEFTDPLTGAAGADADLVGYEYINFPENFYFNYLTARFGRATDVVMIALERFGPPHSGLGSTTITFTTPPAALAAVYEYDVRYWDADEREFSGPRDRVDCFDIRSVNELSANNVASVATRGFGWMNVLGVEFGGFNGAGQNRALLVTLDRPSIAGVLDAFAEWPAHDVSPVGEAVPPYEPTTYDVSFF